MGCDEIVNWDEPWEGVPSGVISSLATGVPIKAAGTNQLRTCEPNFRRLWSQVRARVAELADAPDLGSGVVTRGGSSPLSRTELKPLGKAMASVIATSERGPPPGPGPGPSVEATNGDNLEEWRHVDELEASALAAAGSGEAPPTCARSSAARSPHPCQKPGSE